MTAPARDPAATGMIAFGLRAAADATRAKQRALTRGEALTLLERACEFMPGRHDVFLATSRFAVVAIDEDEALRHAAADVFLDQIGALDPVLTLAASTAERAAATLAAASVGWQARKDLA